MIINDGTLMKAFLNLSLDVKFSKSIFIKKIRMQEKLK